MKKIIFTFLILILFPVFSLAAEPTIRSDSSTFNPLSGVYNLQGNVFVQFPAHDKTLTITGNETKVNIYQLEVHGQGNIILTYDNLNFHCDKVDVYHSERTAYVTGNIKFNTPKVTINADMGSFCWKTKLASFKSNVTVNGKKQTGDVIYNVVEEKFVQ